MDIREWAQFVLLIISMAGIQSIVGQQRHAFVPDCSSEKCLASPPGCNQNCTSTVTYSTTVDTVNFVIRQSLINGSFTWGGISRLRKRKYGYGGACAISEGGDTAPSLETAVGGPSGDLSPLDTVSDQLSNKKAELTKTSPGLEIAECTFDLKIGFTHQDCVEFTGSSTTYVIMTTGTIQGVPRRYNMPPYAGDVLTGVPIYGPGLPGLPKETGQDSRGAGTRIQIPSLCSINFILASSIGASATILQ